MKIWIYQIIIMVVTVLCIVFLKIPFWLFLLAGIPALVILSTYLTFLFSFRPNLQPVAVPESGFKDRIASLEQDKLYLQQIGFDFADSFYLKTIPDTVIYCFLYRDRPVCLCIYHFGTKKSCDLVTVFGGDISLTTSSNVGAGLVPHPVGRMLQIVEGASYEKLLAEHLSALDFLYRDRMLSPVPLYPSEIRDRIMKSVREFVSRVREYFFWPARLVIWTVTKRGKHHCRPLAQQFADGYTKL